MHLYDVFYKGSSFDRDTPLPPASAAIRYAKNTNWDGHIKVPVKVGNKYEWRDQ